MQAQQCKEEANMGGQHGVGQEVAAAEKEVNGAQVDKCTRSGKATSLHRAAYAGQIEVVKALLKAGADVFKEDADGLRPVEKAEAQGHVEIVKLLVDAAFANMTPCELFFHETLNAGWLQSQDISMGIERAVSALV
ncbi:hypothetical protein GOP47_0005983 [Adiantum capillus-veneris]|uniref:Uncharacterized protein n=1 Tax=Adiantum capillus-veneris TaxID=13818 RepID=A0A9D4V3J7_ADICA|nr:hypothetical protein GOP47_0005983 [Adiantum capillus-veneris]